MEELNKALSEFNLPQVDEEQYEAIKTASERAQRDTNMRTANIRISEVNKINFDNEDLGVKAGDTVTYTKEDIIKILEDWNRTKAFKYYLIEHNENPENKHLHIVIEFEKNSVCKFSLLKKKFPYGNIETCKHGVKSCVQYLIHMQNCEKYQYSWDDVVTNAPAKLELYKVPSKHTTDAKLNYYIEQIVKGNIKRYELGIKVDYDIYTRYETRLLRAFKFRNEKEVVDVDRDFMVYVLQGPPRVGKSTFAKNFAKTHNMSIGFSSGGKHPFDEYRGQEVFVLDDYNYDVTSINDMKKNLDPHNNTGADARYHNVIFKNCKVVFICTNTPIVDWYITESKEDREAFLKRISYVLDFEGISEDYVATYTVNEIAYYGEDDFVEIYRNIYHDYKKYVLKPVDDIKHTFDLKKYVNPADDEEKKKQFLADIAKL